MITLVFLLQEKEADKWFERLLTRIGGEAEINKMIEDLEREEVEGEVKASSKEGDWY